MMTRRTRLFVTLAAVLCLLGTAAWAGLDDIVLVRNDGYIFHVNGQTLGSLGNTSLGMAVSDMKLQSTGDIVAARSDGYVYNLSGNDLSLKAYANWGGPLAQMVMLSNNNFVGINSASTLYVGSGATMQPTGAWLNIAQPVTAVTALNASPDLMVAYGNGYVGRLNGSTLNIDTWNNWGDINRIAAGPTDKLTITNTANTTYAANSDGTYAGSWVNFGQAIAQLEFRSDGDPCFVLAGGGNIIVRPISNLASPLYEMYLGGPNKVAIRPDGSAVAINSAGTAYAMDSHLVYSGLYYPLFGTVTFMQSQSDGDIVINNTAGDLFLIDGATLAIKGHVIAGYAGITHMAIQDAVPEPGSLAALATGLAGLLGCCLRRRK